MMRANMNMRLVCASLLFIHAAAAAAAAHAPNRHVPSANQLHKAHAAMVAATKLLPADQALAERVIFESEGLWFGDDDEAQQHFQAWCDHLQDEHRRQAPYHQERPWAMTGSTSSTARRSLAEEAARLQEPQVGEITSQQDVRDALSGIAGEEQEAPAAQALAARWSAPMCQDTLASNAGAASPCTYDCAELQAQFFPGDWNPDRDSCYLYNQFTASWPQALLDRKKTQLVKKKPFLAQSILAFSLLAFSAEFILVLSFFLSLVSCRLTVDRGSSRTGIFFWRLIPRPTDLHS